LLNTFSNCILKISNSCPSITGYLLPLLFCDDNDNGELLLLIAAAIVVAVAVAVWGVCRFGNLETWKLVGHPTLEQAFLLPYEKLRRSVL
jgi:hypothetical protein